MRRRAAIWLIAAWSVFSVSQAIAVCCVDAGGLSRTSSETLTVSHHDAAASHHDLCDTSEDSLGQPCPTVIGETPPLVTMSALPLPAQTPYAYPVPSSFQLSPGYQPAAGSNGIARMVATTAPPDPIYLRLQRFLI